MTAGTLLWTLGAWAQAHWASRWPTHRFVRAGFAVTALGLAAMLLVLREDVTWLAAIGAFGVAGFGMGLAYSPLAIIVLHEASPEGQGSATSALSLTDRLGRPSGRGCRERSSRPACARPANPAAGLAVAFTVGALIGLGGLALTGRLRPRTHPASALTLSAAPPRSSTAPRS